ncbi:MAG: acetyltransferase [Lachnospiraceae bacterium]|jgi:sugar O-acyltransferase (sialic acid O-acetyltransferase NeuD family)
MVLGIYCAGGFGGVTLGLANKINELDNKWEKIYFIEDNEEKANIGENIITFAEFNEKHPADNAEIVIAAGEPRTREILFNKVKTAGYTLPNLIHPWANVENVLEIGEGNIILTFACVSASGVKIGNNNIVMQYAQISHDSVIGSHCVIATSANISGTTVVRDRAYIAVGAKLREGITVGYDAIAGMGAIVTKSIDDQSVVMGIPAKEVRKNTGKVFK